MSDVKQIQLEHAKVLSIKSKNLVQNAAGPTWLEVTPEAASFLGVPEEPCRTSEEWPAWLRARNKTVKAAFAQFGIKVSYSARRMCRCGCSPAFYLKKDDTSSVPRRGHVCTLEVKTNEQPA